MSHTASPQLPEDSNADELHGDDVPSYDVKPAVGSTDTHSDPTAVEVREALPDMTYTDSEREISPSCWYPPE